MHGLNNIQHDGTVCHGPGQPDALFRATRNCEENVKTQHTHKTPRKWRACGSW